MEMEKDLLLSRLSYCTISIDSSDTTGLSVLSKGSINMYTNKSASLRSCCLAKDSIVNCDKPWNRTVMGGCYKKNISYLVNRQLSLNRRWSMPVARVLNSFLTALMNFMSWKRNMRKTLFP